MPLPKANDKQTTARLEALYDRLAEVAMVELIKKTDGNFDDEVLAKFAYSIATAMLNERNKK